MTSNKKEFLAEWNEQQFQQMNIVIPAYFSNKNLQLHNGNKITGNLDFDKIDEILGLAYTSSSSCAMYSICNCEINHDSTYKYESFIIGEDGKQYAILWDKEENEKIICIGGMNTKEDILQNCIVEGIVIKLPPQQLSRDLYTEVKNSLELIGGKWKGGRVQGFEFKEDPTELLNQIANGEKRNLKKEFQFFGTPESLAHRLVELATITKKDRILEPSAGQGAIVKAIFKAHNFIKQVDCCELMPVNETILQKIDGVLLIANDFLSAEKFDNYYTKIIANPPFSKNQDIEHIRKMYDCCKLGGRIVTIASNHWKHSGNKKEVAFKEWLKELNAEIIQVDAGEFKESGTSIATCIIIINKTI